MPTLYAHLPSVKMEPDERSFADGRLVRLPFDDWQALDSEFEFSDVKYRKADPVFWIRELDDSLGSERDVLTTAAHRLLWDVHTALLLELSAPLLPTPLLSCLYIQLEGDAVLRSIGAMDREFIAYGSPLPYTFESDGLDDADVMHRYLVATRVHDLTGTIRAGLDVLDETARPDSWFGGDLGVARAHGFVRCMAAAERILLPREHDFEKGQVTKTFGRHAGALLGAQFDDRDGTSEHAAGLYRLRNEMLHGHRRPDPTDEALNKRFAEGRRLLRGAVYAALTIRDHVSDSAPLWRWLAECWDQPEQQKRLVDALNDGGAA
jgi:hypothetical protein